MHKVSYIITIYNKAPCIPKLIESLKNQVGPIDAEYIFIDDGSSDDSLKVLHDLCKDMPNAVIITQENTGPSIAINKAVKYATKQWLLLSDGDDFIVADATMTLIELATKYNAKFCHGRHSNTLGARKYSGNVSIYRDPLKRVLRGYYTMCSLVDRELFLSMGGCDERVFIQDYSYVMRAAKHTDIIHIDKLTAYNIDGQQERLSSNKQQEHYNELLARYLFLKDNMDISYDCKYTALKKQMSRGSSWYRKKTLCRWFISKHLARYIISRIDFKFSDETILKWMRESMEFYSLSNLV